MAAHDGDGSSAILISFTIAAVAILFTMFVVSILLDFCTSVRIHFAYRTLPICVTSARPSSDGAGA
eukprot:4625296-Prymnesium_polylepis.1